jgi:hypothetical protein
MCLKLVVQVFNLYNSRKVRLTHHLTWKVANPSPCPFTIQAPDG